MEDDSIAETLVIFNVRDNERHRIDAALQISYTNLPGAGTVRWKDRKSKRKPRVGDVSTVNRNREGMHLATGTYGILKLNVPQEFFVGVIQIT